MSDDKSVDQSEASESKASKLAELVEQQPQTKKVRIQTGTQTSQLDYARRMMRGQKRK